MSGTPLTSGSRIPNVTFKTRTRHEPKDATDTNPFSWKDVTSESLFKGKRSVLFALPGAFTPTCSTTHLPGFEASYKHMKKLGIDEVYCLSVNDPFVMRQWGLHQGLPEDKTPDSLGFTNVKLLPDGNAAFTRGMGMNVHWDKQRGFGERSWRYSCVIGVDMQIEKMFCEAGFEDEHKADPFKVSDADTMVKYLEKVEKSNHDKMMVKMVKKAAAAAALAAEKK